MDIGKRLNFTNSSISNPIKQKTLYRWFSVIDAALYQKKALIPVKKLKDSFLLNKELHHTLYGFIVFEVEWAHVRGINYLNELQVSPRFWIQFSSYLIHESNDSHIEF